MRFSATEEPGTQSHHGAATSGKQGRATSGKRSAGKRIENGKGPQRSGKRSRLTQRCLRLGDDIRLAIFLREA